jgi:cell division transport system ATP-binding protein
VASVIEFKDVSKIYKINGDDYAALTEVNFKIEPKEFVSISGPSGAGKSTLLKLLLGREKPTTGQVFFNNQDIELLDSEEMSHFRRSIGMVFQDFKLLSRKTVTENISFAMEVVGRTNEEIAEDVPQVLELVGLSEKADYFPHQLSGGEKQRVSIARALIHRPEVILADEPTGNLDLLNTWDIVRLLLKINEIGTTIILATHDREIINNLNRRVITLNKGRIVRDEEHGRYIL